MFSKCFVGHPAAIRSQTERLRRNAVWHALCIVLFVAGQAGGINQTQREYTTMFATTKSDLSRIAVSAIGALAVSSACILGAVGPAKAAAPTTVPAWQTQVEHRIARATPGMADHFGPVPGAVATVAVHFSAAGEFAGATLASSTGFRLLDRHAVSFARSLRYPRLPDAVRGHPQDVTMRLDYGPAPDEARPVRMVALPATGTQLASR